MVDRYLMVIYVWFLMLLEILVNCATLVVGWMVPEQSAHFIESLREFGQADEE